jgi:hypothetical protein
MRLQKGNNSFSDTYNTGTLYVSRSQMSPSTGEISYFESSSWYHTGSTLEKKRRSLLLRRLKNGNGSSRPYSRSPSVSSPVGTEPPSRRGSQEWQRVGTPAPYERPESSAKSILSRGGRMLRRHGSKFSLSSFILDEESEHSRLEVSETCQRPQQCPQKTKSLGSKSKIDLWSDCHANKRDRRY